MLRTDRGGEYLSEKFKNYCAQHGITRQLTTALTPEQNGVSERKNQIVLDRARSMTQQTRLPASLWAEIINTANHLVNNSPTNANDGLTPEQVFTGKWPNLSYLRTFGCDSYVFIPKEDMKSKLSPRANKCVLLGYDEQLKVFHCYNPKTRKITISRNVVFDKQRFGGVNEDMPQDFSTFQDITFFP